MPSDLARDKMPLIGPSKRLAKGKKKPAKKTGRLGTPKRKATKKRPAKKSKK
jgi:hypothetical protein